MINWGLLVLILYALYYTALEPAAGLSWGVLLGIPMWLTATAICQHVPHAWAWALGLHILSWFLQVWCHSSLISMASGFGIQHPGLAKQQLQHDFCNSLPIWTLIACSVG